MHAQCWCTRQACGHFCGRFCPCFADAACRGRKKSVKARAGAGTKLKGASGGKKPNKKPGGFFGNLRLKLKMIIGFCESGEDAHPP